MTTFPRRIFEALLIILIGLGSSYHAFGQCPTLVDRKPKLASWQPQRYVMAEVGPNLPLEAVETALDNWSLASGSTIYCFGPIFSDTYGNGPVLTINSTTIPMVGGQTI